jgi:arabinan endo-1,5-alpha-L-arabinosidase
MTEVTTNELSDLYKSTSFSQISVHDPSVVWDATTGYFYIYGSHYFGGKSKDLRNWSPITNYYNTSYDKAFKSNPTHTVKRCLPGKTTVDEVTLGSYDAGAHCATYAGITVGERGPVSAAQWLNGDQWAPDIVYNPNMGKWCYYLSLNGDYWASVVVLMTSSSPTGPFKYEAPVVFGGFDGQSRSGVSVDYKKTDLEVVLGPLSSLPSRYRTNSWGSIYPNCIDPCAFFDETGELWLAYGSWSGGIYMLKLDKETGLRDYTHTYTGTGSTPDASALSDAYFGKKIAGGYYVSGEGPYIQHFGQYYYLFMSYGGFSPDGGYEMRVFRSEAPDGPYVDANGMPATYADVNRWVLNFGKGASTNRGMKLIGAMNGWGNMTVGECAQGHNSACTDGQGRNFLVCHTKFNNGTAGHTVRSYQLYTNKQGWLVCAPFQFAGETVTDADIAAGCPFTDADIAGDYHVLIHPYKLDHNAFEEATPATIHLTADGRVTGDYQGTWSVDEGTAYFTLKLGGSIYSGVLTEQTLEYNTAKTVSFTTVCCTRGNVNCGVPVWGYKLAPKSAIAYNYQQHSSTHLKASNLTRINRNVSIVFDPVENTQLNWTSSEPGVLSNTGKYNPDTVGVDLTMTARLTSGRYYWEKEYNARCLKAADVTGDPYTGLVAYYNFDESPTLNVVNEEQKVTYGRSNSSGKVPTLETDYDRFGQVCHQYFAAIGSNSYSRIDNPLLGHDDLEGFSVSLWVKRADQNNYDALWSFFGSTLSRATGERLFLTGNSYIGYNDNQDNWFDVNHPETKTVSNIAVGEWSLVTFTYSKTNGYNLYVNGTKYLSTNLQYRGSVEKNEFDRSLVTKFASSAKYFYLGLGSFWGSADACFDDLAIYSRELEAADVRGLYTLFNRVNSFPRQAKRQRGDIDGDGSVTVADITILINAYLGQTDAYATELCDLDGDGSLSVSDITTLISLYLGTE